MQRPLLIVFAVAAIVAAAFAFYYRSDLAKRDAKLRELTVQLAAAKDAHQDAIEETAPLRENVARLTAERDRLKAGVQASSAVGSPPLQPAAVAPKPGEGAKGMFGGFAKMFQTEEGKEMLRSQTAMVMKLQYADLAKQLKLSPQEAEQVMALLADRQSALAGETFGAFSENGFDETKMKALSEKAEAKTKEYNEKLKAVLGEERFAQLESYDRTIGDRMVLSQFEGQFSAAGSPLDASQKDQLLKIMSAERAKSPASPFAQGNANPGAALSALKDDAAVDRWVQQEQQYQERVLSSATSALSPDQVNTLRQAFQQQVEMQKFGLKMSREMFKGDGGAIVVPGPPLR
jgi:hypothetical protein